MQFSLSPRNLGQPNKQKEHPSVEKQALYLEGGVVQGEENRLSTSLLYMQQQDKRRNSFLKNAPIYNLAEFLFGGLLLFWCKKKHFDVAIVIQIQGFGPQWRGDV